MNKGVRKISRDLRNTARGASLIESALLVCCVCLTIAIAVKHTGEEIKEDYAQIADCLGGGSCSTQIIDDAHSGAYGPPTPVETPTPQPTPKPSPTPTPKEGNGDK